MRASSKREGRPCGLSSLLKFSRRDDFRFGVPGGEVDGDDGNDDGKVDDGEDDDEAGTADPGGDESVSGLSFSS